MNYLEITQEVALRSGTNPGTIASVESDTLSIQEIASVVQSAWLEIQNMSRSWRFLRKELPETANFEAGIRRYTAQNIASPALTDWAEWIPGDAPGTVPLTMWRASGDRGDEAPLAYIEDYPVFRRRYEVGRNATLAGRPSAVSIDTEDRLVIWPVPDDDYNIAGTYRRSAQTLSADGDVPIIAEEYHQIIVHAAKLLIDHIDEADSGVLLADIELPMTFKASLASLKRRYLGGRGVKLRHRPVGGSGVSRVREPLIGIVSLGSQ